MIPVLQISVIEVIRIEDSVSDGFVSISVTIEYPSTKYFVTIEYFKREENIVNILSRPPPVRNLYV